MIVSSSTLDGLRTQFSLIFWDAYKATEPWAPKISTEVPGIGKSTTYGWIAQSLKLREWLGPRIAVNLSEHSQVIINKSFEGTVEVSRDDIEDDNLGMYTSLLVPEIAQAVKKHADQLIVRLLQSVDERGNAITINSFDGRPWFDTAHSVFDKGANTYSNYSASGMALSATNFNTVWSTMVSYTGEDGQPLLVNPGTLFVPPQLKLVALQLMQATTAAQPIRNVAGTEVVAGAGIENMLKGWAEVVVLPELAGQPATWYLADTSKTIKPVVYQKRRAPEFVSRVAPNDPKVFDQKTYTYGVDYRGQVGPTLPFLIYKAAA